VEKDNLVSSGILYTQVIDTFPPNSDPIWDKIDLLEGDPQHRGAALRKQEFKPFWLGVLTSRCVYKLKRNAKTSLALLIASRPD
jgi:hypothetical protein